MTNLNSSRVAPGSRSRALGVGIALATVVMGANATAAPAQESVIPAENLRPLHFEPNRGQVDRDVLFLARAPGGEHLFKATGTELRVALSMTQTAAVEMSFIQSRSDVTVTAQDELGAHVNYVLGSDPDKWLYGVPTFTSLHYDALYPGIDLEFHSWAGVMKGTYTVSPGTDPSLIRWRYTGATGVRVTESGEVEIGVGDGRGLILEGKPVAWQIDGEDRHPVEVAYALGPDGALSFRVAAFDVALPLIIDPTVIFTKTWGVSAGQGIDVEGDAVYTVANVGWDQTLVAQRWHLNGYPQWTTFVGGGGVDQAQDVVAGNNRVYVVGLTRSADFPLTAGIASGGSDLVVVALDSTSGSVAGSIRIGGSADDYGLDIALAGGWLTAIGGSLSPTIAGGSPSPPAPFASTNHGGSDVLVARLDPVTLAVDFAAFLGGRLDDCPLPANVTRHKMCSVAADASGRLAIAGGTDSADFPLKHPFRAASQGIPGLKLWTAEAFVSLFAWSTNVPALVYSTFLGGQHQDWINDLVLDDHGAPIVVGGTFSPDFPLEFSHDVHAGSLDAFVTKFAWNASTSELTLVFSSLFGGTNHDELNSLALDRQGHIYATGDSWAGEWGTPLGPTGLDIQILALQGNGAVENWHMRRGTYLMDFGAAIEVDSTCDVYVTGRLGSTQFLKRIGHTCQPSIDPDTNILELAGGEKFKETITVTIPAAPACVIDIYVMADTTGSMAGSKMTNIKTNLKAAFADIESSLTDCDVAVGVGSFENLNDSPFVHQVAITPNLGWPNTAIDSWVADGGGSSGSTLYALNQVASSPSIGWRPNSTHRWVIWVGDVPGVEAVCSLGPKLDRTIVAGALKNAEIRAVSVDVSYSGNLLDSSPKAGCTGAGPGQAAFITAATGGAQYHGSFDQLASGIKDQVQASAAQAVCLTPTADIAGAVKVVSPQCYNGTYDATVENSFPFEMVFEHPCTNAAQILEGKLNATIGGGSPIVAKNVRITIPPCDCFTNPNGDLVAWGNYQYGDIGGIPATVSPVTAPGEFKAVSSSGSHTLALDQAGAVHGWGAGTDVPTGSGFQAIAAGLGFSIAIDSSGHLVSWGVDPWGRMPGSETPGNCQPGTDPETKRCTEASRLYTAIAAGDRSSAAIDVDGNLHGWGENSFLQLPGSHLAGCPVTTAYCTMPGDFVDLDVGAAVTVAVDNLGRAHGWGYNPFGGLPGSCPSPDRYCVDAARKYEKVAAGGDTLALAREPSGKLTLWAWPPEAAHGREGQEYIAVVVGKYVVAAIRPDGTLDSWGGFWTDDPPITPPSGQYCRLAAGGTGDGDHWVDYVVAIKCAADPPLNGPEECRLCSVFMPVALKLAPLSHARPTPATPSPTLPGPSATPSVTADPNPPTETATTTPLPTVTPTASASASPSPTVTPPSGTPVPTTPAPPACAPLDSLPGLAAWWSLEEGAGELAQDRIENPVLNQGIILGQPAAWAAGKVGLALHFDGATTAIDVPDAPSLDFGSSPAGDLTLDLWVRLRANAFTEGVRSLVNKQESSGAPGYQMYLRAGRPGLQLADASGWSNFEATAVVPKDDRWHLVAVTVDRDQTDGGRFYIDGAPAGTFDPTARSGTLENAGLLRIGAPSFQGGVSRFDGWMDEVEVIRSALSPEAVAVLYQADAVGKCAPAPPTMTPKKVVLRHGILGNSPRRVR